MMAHSPGPFAVENCVSEIPIDIICDYKIPGEGFPVLLASCYPDKGDEERDRRPTQAEALGNAKLFAAAAAMEVALELLTLGLARIERSSVCPTLVEFCFNGLRFSMNGDWNGLIGIVGWDKARAAIAETKARFGETKGGVS